MLSLFTFYYCIGDDSDVDDAKFVDHTCAVEQYIVKNIVFPRKRTNIETCHSFLNFETFLSKCYSIQLVHLDAHYNS